MEAVLKNLERTAELLAVTQTDGVKEWDKQTVNRAFQWSRYSEQLYLRFHTNPTIRKMLENHLQVTNERLRETFQGAYTDITFARLSQCQQFLLATLLKNPAFPSSLLKQLFDTSSSWETTEQGCQGAIGQCSHLIQYTSACKVLSAIEVGHTAACPKAEVQSVLLLERLDALHKVGGNGALGKEFLDSALQICGELDNLSEVIAVALLSRRNDTMNNVTGISEDLLLDWLLRNDMLLQNMCSTLSLTLLLNLAQQFLKFRVAYCNTLKEWAANMEYDLNKGEWVQTLANGMPFKTITNHFRSLLNTCPVLKGETIKELNALKIAEGDFDVRGLSVWGDLVHELK